MKAAADIGTAKLMGAIDTSFDSDVAIAGRFAHVKADFTLPPDKGPISGDATITHLDLRSLGSGYRHVASWRVDG